MLGGALFASRGQERSRTLRQAQGDMNGIASATRMTSIASATRMTSIASATRMTPIASAQLA
jgi:hypothetical protein